MWPEHGWKPVVTLPELRSIKSGWTVAFNLTSSWTAGRSRKAPILVEYRSTVCLLSSIRELTQHISPFVRDTAVARDAVDLNMIRTSRELSAGPAL